MSPLRAIRSTSWRMTLLVASGIILLSLGAMAAQYQITKASLAARQAELLRADLATFAALYDQRRIVGLRQAIKYRVDSGVEAGQALYLLQDRNGAKLAGNIEGWPDGMQRDQRGFEAEVMVYFTVGQTNYLGVGRELRGGFPFLAARSQSAAQATLADLRVTIGWMAAGLMVAALLIGHLVSRWVLARVARVNAVADRVGSGDLAARIPGSGGGDEFAALEDHVNQLLDRIQGLNQATTRLSDTIAHELRTPLNRILQRLSRLHGQDDRVDEIRGEMRATIQIFDALLDISSAEAAQGQRPGLVPVNLSALVAQVCELYEPLAEERELGLRVRVCPDLVVLGERSLLAQQLSNLLENAIKYCRPGDVIRLCLVPEGERHMLEINDTGPGVPDELRSHLFDVFTRAERDHKISGHGLGLALVQAIAARHGAQLSLPETDKGFAIRIHYPKLSPIETEAQTQFD